MKVTLGVQTSTAMLAHPDTEPEAGWANRGTPARGILPKPEVRFAESI